MLTAAFIVTTLSVGLGVLCLPLSRNGRMGLEAPPVYWVWGPPAWRAFCWMLPLFTVSGVCMVVGFGLSLSVPERTELWFPLAAAWLAFAALAFVVGVTVRPKFLVPRQLREQPGYFRDLLDERERRRDK